MERFLVLYDNARVSYIWLRKILVKENSSISLVLGVKLVLLRSSAQCLMPQDTVFVHLFFLSR